MTKAFATRVAHSPWANLGANLALAGALDPDCTVEKATKGAAANDWARRAAGVDDKGRLEKDAHDDEDFIKKAVK